MTQPNFVVFLTDDQGYGDLSCMGTTDFCTPHIDRLAASGARFTNWYSNSPVCSPSRAGLLTGRYPGRAGVRSILAGHRQATGLSSELPTLASEFKNAGYRTAMFGKWHLGVAEGFRPEDHAFDEWYGFLAGCIDYYSHIFYWGMADGKTDPTHDLWENGDEVYENGRYFTEIITEKATDFIRRASEVDEPFFLYVPYNAPHYPMHAPQKYLDRFPHLPWDRQIMAAMMSAVDDSVGDIMAALARHGLYDNTCVFYQSDNGPSRETRNWLDGTPDLYYGGTTGGLKGHKFSLYDGGIRVPGIMAWPGHIPAGQVIDTPAAAMDVLPTFLSFAGAEIPAGVDGVDLSEFVTGGAEPEERPIFWEMNTQTAVRRGKWKLVLNGHLMEGVKAEDAVHLANLDADPGESENLADAMPELTAELKTLAESWRENLEAEWDANWASRPTSLTGHSGG